MHSHKLEVTVLDEIAKRGRVHKTSGWGSVTRVYMAVPGYSLPDRWLNSYGSTNMHPSYM